MGELSDIKQSIFDEKPAKKCLTDKNAVIALVFSCFVMAIIVYKVTPVREGITDLWGNNPSAREIRASVIKTLFIFFPIVSFFLGFLVSLIPYKQKRYREKYLSFLLLTLLGVYTVILVLRIISLL
jgi:formate hydrogenlyase subunit 3/multisubunit Na+/H+ antiporter MnhD subunit